MKEQLVEVVKEALDKDKELVGSVKKRFGFVIFKQGGDNDDVKALEQKWKKLVSPGHVVANVEKRHLDEAQDQLRISSRKGRPVMENVEKRHLDEAQHQLRGSSSRDRYVMANLEESQDQPWVWSGRDRCALANVEKRHLDEAQDQTRVSSRRDEKPEFVQSAPCKGKREALAVPEVGAIGTLGASYLRSYGDEEQLRRQSWNDDYQQNYLLSGYWRGQHWFGVSAYDPPLTGARTFNADFGQASSALVAMQGTAEYRLNTLLGGTSAAPMNQLA